MGYFQEKDEEDFFIYHCYELDIFYPRTRREKDCRSLSSSTLRWFTWVRVIFQLVGPHLAADRSCITPETAHRSLSFSVLLT